MDELFAPLVLPAAGQHGAERRDAQGGRHRYRFAAQALRRVAGGIRTRPASRARVRRQGRERRRSTIGSRPSPPAAYDAVREAARPLGDSVEVQGGKMVVELKPAGCDKGRAIETFMQEAPFAGRVPVFLGDDVTDEFGFRVVNRLGGHSVKVGEGNSAARWRLENPVATRACICQPGKCGSASSRPGKNRDSFADVRTFRIRAQEDSPDPPTGRSESRPDERQINAFFRVSLGKLPTTACRSAQPLRSSMQPPAACCRCARRTRWYRAGRCCRTRVRRRQRSGFAADGAAITAVLQLRWRSIPSSRPPL